MTNNHPGLLSDIPFVKYIRETIATSRANDHTFNLLLSTFVDKGADEPYLVDLLVLLHKLGVRPRD